MKAMSGGLWISILVTAVGISALAGQEAQDSLDPLAQAMEEVAREIEQGDSLGWSTSVPPPAVLMEADSALRARYLEALHDYHRWGLTHRQAVYRWQFLSTKVTFATVLLLVLSGITFAGIQFYKALKVATSGQVGDKDARSSRSDDGGEGGGAAAPDTGTTELELTTKGIKVSSPVLGVIILVLSLGFFYLYLVYVYPIQETF